MLWDCQLKFFSQVTQFCVISGALIKVQFLHICLHLMNNIYVAKTQVAFQATTKYGFFADVLSKVPTEEVLDILSCWKRAPFPLFLPNHEVLQRRHHIPR